MQIYTIIMSLVLCTTRKAKISNDVSQVDQYTQNINTMPQYVSLLLNKFLLFIFTQKGLVTHQRKQHKIDLVQVNGCLKFVLIVSVQRSILEEVLAHLDGSDGSD